MKNWAGNITWNPSEVAYPTTEEEIQQIVLRAANSNKNIRVIGTGHSFTALCQTDNILMSLDKYQGLISIDKEQLQATVKGGTKLNLLGDLLFDEGLAMENLGDIDVQSIAGTISTGTHGTGTAFGTISTQITALRFVNGKGEIINCSETENRELFKAAQVSIGALGIITEVTIQCVPIYKLAVKTTAGLMSEVIENLQGHLDNNRNFEFFWLPYTDKLAMKSSNIVKNLPCDEINFLNYWTEYVLENHALKLLCDFAKRFPSKTQAVSKFTAKLISDVTKVNYSHKIYATQRLVKFREMEYNIPAEAYHDVWKEVVKIANSGKYNVHFPIENRWVKQDDILMSPAYGRDSAYIACHVYSNKDCVPYFKALEEVFRAHEGRPHWGKMHTLKQDDIAESYPMFSTFLKHRAEQDPNNVFVTPYVQSLLGLSNAVESVAV